MSKEEFLISKENPLKAIFYPISLSDGRITGVGIADHIPSQLYVLQIANFYLLRFSTPEIFLFQMKSDQLDFFRNNNYNKGDSFVFANNKFENYANSNAKNQFCMYEDEYTKDPNPLKHTVTKSKKIEDREKKCLFLAMNFGFPLVDIVSFSQKTILKFKNEIIDEWDNIIKSQHGNLENDFINTLKRGTKVIKNEYSDLFIELTRLSGENSLPAAKPLFSFANTSPEINLLSRILPPKIFFNQVSIKAIFNLEKELATEYSETLSSAFKDLKYRIEIEHTMSSKFKEGDRYRIEFQINLVFPEYVDLSDIRWKLEEIRNIILVKLGDFDLTALEAFSRGKMEIWLKEVNLQIVVHNDFKRETISLLKKKLRWVLDHKSIVDLPISKDLVEITFKLSFDKITDYSISEIETFSVMPDRYTRLAVEKLYRGKFSEASKYLRMGKNGLLGDICTIDAEEAKSGSSDELLRKARYYYRKAKLDDSNILEGYFNNQFKEKVLEAFETNSDWIISLKLFLEAKKEKKNAGLYRRYSGLNIDKNLNDFTEEIGDFYSSLLRRLQRKYGIPPKKMLGFDF